MTCTDWITILDVAASVSGVITSIIFSALALWQNHRYKKLADNFSDLQYMPEFYRGVSNICGAKLESLGYGYGLSLGSFRTMNGPIYHLLIQTVEIDGIRQNEDSRKYSEPSDRNDLNLPPTEPDFSVKISVPEKYIDNKQHQCVVVFTYENMYYTKYEKTASLKFIGTRAPNGSQDIQILGDIILERAQRRQNNG